MTAPPASGAVESEDRLRFEEFYRREFPRMVTLATAMTGSRTAGEDIAQDALLAAQQRWAVRRHEPGTEGLSTLG